jgi:hypothetical protein
MSRLSIFIALSPEFVDDPQRKRRGKVEAPCEEIRKGAAHG